MRWPWSRSEPEREVREDQPFTDAIVSAILAEAAGSATSSPAATGALEAAANIYARAFAAARVTGSDAITPACMALVGRNLIRRGEDLHVIEVRRGRLRLIPVGSWDVRGGWDEAGWWYRADLFGPSGNVTRLVPSDGVLHFRYAVDSARPWHGIAPLAWASITGALAARLELRLSEEAGAPVGSVIPVPQDGADKSLTELRNDLRKLKGNMALVETTAAGHGDGRQFAPREDWEPKRFGADPPATLPALRSDVGQAVLGACGVPPSLFLDADGTSQRESWRRFIMGSVEPLLNQVAGEFSVKLDAAVSFDLMGLWAHDLQGRAAAFQKLVAGGVAVTEALTTSGLLAGEGA